MRNDHNVAPVIGITTYGRTEKKVPSEADDQHFVLPAAYVDAVRRAGGVAILLPPGETHIDGWLGILDGVIFSGGADVNPTYYNGNADHPKLGDIDEERDTTEFAFLSSALKRKDLPLLMVCRGLQVLNVAQGGTLHEHIADVNPDNIHQGVDTIWTLQDVGILPKTILSRIIESPSVKTMSGHHQGVESIGVNLIAAGVAADNILEALEHTEHPFCIAVQWHPEMTAQNDVTQQNIFDALVRTASWMKRERAD